MIPEIGAPEMATTWIEDIRTWPAPMPEDDGISLLRSTLEGLPKRFGTVGVVRSAMRAGDQPDHRWHATHV